MADLDSLPASPSAPAPLVAAAAPAAAPVATPPPVAPPVAAAPQVAPPLPVAAARPLLRPPGARPGVRVCYY